MFLVALVCLFVWGGGGSLSPPRLNIFYSGQYGSNDLPWPRRSALSECVCVCVGRGGGVE